MVVQFPDRLAFLFQPARYKVAYGGRGGAKSWNFARALLLQAGLQPLRVLCTRELQVSIEESVHKLLADQIEQLGMSGLFEVQQRTILGRNGSSFIFTGLRNNITKIKSMEGVDRVWCEEAETISNESWNVLIPTIRKAGSEVWITFNPRERTDPTWQRFGPAERDGSGKLLREPPPGAVVVEMSWRDNPWLPDELRREKDYLYRVDPEAADHVWGGKFRKNSQASVLRGRWRVEAIVLDSSWTGPYQGGDWGFATDPSALVRCWVRPRIGTGPGEGPLLYVEHEAYSVGIEVDQTPALFDRVPGARKYVTRADSARPETISFMQRHGYPLLVAAQKGPGSVEEGVEHLRSYEAIIIHPRCTHAQDEARLWSFRVDKLSGDVLPELVDKHNHVMDALRYALEPLITPMEGQGIFDFYEREAAELARQRAAQG